MTIIQKIKEQIDISTLPERVQDNIKYFENVLNLDPKNFISYNVDNKGNIVKYKLSNFLILNKIDLKDLYQYPSLRKIEVLIPKSLITIYF